MKKSGSETSSCRLASISSFIKNVTLLLINRFSKSGYADSNFDVKCVTCGVYSIHFSLRRSAYIDSSSEALKLTPLVLSDEENVSRIYVKS